MQLGLSLKEIYGFFKPYHSSNFFGPYINRNHFAGYLEMVLPLNICLLGGILTSENLSKINYQKQLWFGKLELVIILGFSFAIILSALLLSLSRAGVIIGLVLIIAQVSLIMRLVFKDLYGKKLIYFGSIFVAIILIVGIYADWYKLEQRVSVLPVNSVDTYVRYVIYNDTWNMSLNYPQFGIGLGNYHYTLSGYNSWNSKVLSNMLITTIWNCWLKQAG